MGAELRSPDSLAVGLRNKHHSYVYGADPAGYSPHCRLLREEDPPRPAVSGRIMKVGPVPGGGAGGGEGGEQPAMGPREGSPAAAWGAEVLPKIFLCHPAPW